MHEILQEYVGTPRPDVRIDRDAGVLHGVKIIGCVSRNGRIYPNDTLREATSLYENSKVNLDHPDGDPRKPRSYQDRFGVLRNVALREDDGLFADFRFNPKHAVAEQLLWDAEHAPENVGFSHNVEAIVRREDDRVVVDRIVAVRSVDLVADPATTSGLFESAGQAPDDEDEPETETVRFVPDETAAAERETGLLLLCKALLHEISKAVPRWTELLDEPFFETLETVDDPVLLRRLVDDRVRLLEHFRNDPIPDAKPLCREQFVAEKPIDTKTFVKMLTR